MLKELFLRDAHATCFDKKEKTLYFLLLFFFAALYMPGVTWLYNVAMWLFFVYGFWFNSIKQKWKLLQQRKEILLMMGFLLLNAVSAVVSHNQQEGISFLGIRISLFVIPFAIGSIYISDELKERAIAAFANVTSCAAFGCLAWGSYRSAVRHDWSLLYNDNLSDIINFQSIYFAMLVNLAIFSFIYLLSKKSRIINENLLVPVLIILLVVNFLLASRMAIIILYSSAFVFAIIQIIRKKKWLEGITLIMGLLLAGFLLVKFFPKTINRFKELGYTNFDYRSKAKESHFNVTLTADQWNGANIRIAVWQCAWTVIKQHMFLGTNIGDKMDELKKEYANKDFSFGIQTNRNVHNNYLDVWMSLGLAGLLIFMAGFIVLPAYKCIYTNDWYGLMIVISFGLALFAETYLDRTMGNTLLAFFIAFISSYKKTPAADNY
jgi:O-antigen ligase